MKAANVKLIPLQKEDRNQFILDNQEAFRFGALEEFGIQDEHYEEPGEIISQQTIEASIDAKGAEAYRIMQDGKPVGGLVLQIDNETRRNHLDLLFVHPLAHGKGIGFAAWQAVEALHPETRVWETCTPYFEKRNLHFYINKCGFHAVELFGHHHPDPREEDQVQEGDEFLMFRFEKTMKPEEGID